MDDTDLKVIVAQHVSVGWLAYIFHLDDQVDPERFLYATNKKSHIGMLRTHGSRSLALETGCRS